MLNVATIGTSWITDQFIDAIQHSGQYHLLTVYSRDIHRAKAYAKQHHADNATNDLTAMFKDENLDVVYIASPNAFHHEQAVAAVKAGKHVIIEKPIFTNLGQWEEVFHLADQQGVYVFEAARHIHYRNYTEMKQLFNHKFNNKKYRFLGANFTIGQYSSRYEEYMESDQAPNVFNPEFAGGTLYDMGVYPLYVVVDLFGRPLSVGMNQLTGDNGADIHEHYCLIYDGFYVTVFVSKAVHSLNQSEIYIDDEVIRISDITNFEKIEVHSKQAGKVTEINYPVRNWMDDEVAVFADLIQQPTAANREKYIQLKELSRMVLETLMRIQESGQ